MDVDGIAPGRDFRKVIEETLTQLRCAAGRYRPQLARH